MRDHPTRLICAAGLFALGALAATRAAEMPVKEIESSEGQWVFSILPKSFQKNPQVDQTAITEMTAEGKKLAVPTGEEPAYYVAQSGGFHAEGQGPVDAKMPAEADLANCLQHALAVNHFLPATPEHPPTLLIVYHWGLHTGLDQGSSEIEGTVIPDRNFQNLLSRAMLVGGSKFAAELKVVLTKQARVDEMGGPPPGSFLDRVGPLEIFLNRDFRTRQLYEESLADCYYVIASAYDYQAVAHGVRKLLWRSKLTADSGGVAMTDTLPGLILNAGRYLGRDMPVAATLAKPVSRETSTKLGPLEVKEYIDPSKPAPEKPKP